MFKSLRLLLARIIAAINEGHTTTPTAGNSAAQPQLKDFVLGKHYFLTGHELVPCKLLNQRQRRKRCRQAGTY